VIVSRVIMAETYLIRHDTEPIQPTTTKNGTSELITLNQRALLLAMILVLVTDLERHPLF
jgi:hypothetical protein